MARIDNLLAANLQLLPPKPSDTANSEEKKRYSELVSEAMAISLAEELRQRGLDETRPAGQGQLGNNSGAERQIAGGLGAKKVDVTWTTEESGLLLAVSVKSINFRDKKSNNFQKNLTNRRGDMLTEAITLHRRFPYAVLCGLFVFDKDAENDSTSKRHSTFINAHKRLALFTGRSDPADREEQFERFHVLLLDASPTGVSIRAFPVGQPKNQVTMESIIDDLLQLVSQRNPDFYDYVNGDIKKV